MDLAEFLTRYAQHVALLARTKGLLFLFDYRGPTISVSAEESVLQAALARLGRTVLELLDDGFVFVSAQADCRESGMANVAISIAGSGRFANDAQLESALRHLQLVDRTNGFGSPQRADGICPFTGAKVSFAASRSDGVLFTFDLATEGSLVAAGAMPNAKGASAWLISELPQGHQSLARRLQRLGWSTTLFRSCGEALEHLQQMDSHTARPALVVASQSGQVCANSLEPLREALASPTRFILTHVVGEDSAVLSPGIEYRAWPMSPAEIADITRHASGEAASTSCDKALQPPLSLAERPQALVVDDNPVNLLVASGMLQVAGFAVSTAADGTQAVQRCLVQSPQVVLMDIHMPGMDGMQTTRALREMQNEGTLPPFVIVAATADTVSFGQAMCREAGMDGYLSKPLSLRAMEAELARLLPGLNRHLSAY